jgi:hypothetical protein
VLVILHPCQRNEIDKVMRPHEPNNVDDHEPPTRRRDYSLFYFQQNGQRAHLRFTPLGAAVLVLIIVIPVIALLILFFINSRTPRPQVNTNITVQPAAPHSPNTPLIRQPPPPSPAKNIKQPTFSMPKPPIPLASVNNSNGQLAPRQTPQPTPSESPP